MELLSIANALQGVRTLLSAYDGYERARFLDTDFAVREEVRRRTDMVTDHANRIQDRAHDMGMKEFAQELRRVKEALVMLSSDVQFSISSLPPAAHSQFTRMGRSQRRKLVNHDLYTLQMLVKATNTCNQLLEDINQNGDSEDRLLTTARELHDQIGRSRNHLRERNMFIEGLLKR